MENKNLKIEYKNLDELIPYINNPRNNINAIDKVASSIAEFGFKNPIIIDDKNIIIAGHTRLEAAKKLKLNSVPTIQVSDLSEKQIKAFRIADNKTSEFSEWDMKLLELELEDLDGLFTGFDELESALDDEVVEDEFEITEPAEPKSKYGDIYKLGRHRLMCGDSTNISDMNKLLDGELADLLITDPPYNVNYEGNAGKIKNDNMDDLNFRNFLKEAFEVANHFMREGAVFYIWHADSEGYNFRGACRDVDWNIRQCLIWNKNSLVMGRQDYHWKHEPCLYGWKKGSAHLWASDRKQTTVIDFDKPLKSEEHPTMKPVGLFKYQIKNSTKSNDVVLDIFGGSGTTIMACEQSGRRAFMMELDPKYVDVIIERWETFTGEKVELIREGEDDDREGESKSS